MTGQQRNYDGIRRAQREPGLRESLFEMTWRYHFWRTACAVTWVGIAVAVLIAAKQ